MSLDIKKDLDKIYNDYLNNLVFRIIAGIIMFIYIFVFFILYFVFNINCLLYHIIFIVITLMMPIVIFLGKKTKIRLFNKIVSFVDRRPDNDYSHLSKNIKNKLIEEKLYTKECIMIILRKYKCRDYTDSFFTVYGTYITLIGVIFKDSIFLNTLIITIPFYIFLFIRLYIMIKKILFNRDKEYYVTMNGVLLHLLGECKKR